MKNFKDSFLENAHLLVVVTSLIIACAVYGVRHPQNTIDSSFAWFGYAPTSIQYAALNTEQPVVMDQATVVYRESNSVSGLEDIEQYVLFSQGSVDTEQHSLALRNTANDIDDQSRKN